jgi:hypothetical protein
MELTVGLVLILFGILSLTGITQWISNQFAPVIASLP